MEYRQLSSDQQRQMLEQRVVALEADHFNHSLNLKSYETLPDGDKSKVPSIEQTERAMTTIEAAHTAVVAELEALPPAESSS